MRTTILFRTSAVATIITVLLSAGTVLANRDGKDDRDRGGDHGNRAAADRGGQGRSFSGDTGRSTTTRSSDIGQSFRSSDSGRSSDGNRAFRHSDGTRSSDGDRSLRSSDVNRSFPPQ